MKASYLIIVLILTIFAAQAIDVDSTHNCKSKQDRQATIRLQDGTTLMGEVKSLEDDTYTVQTPSMGEVTLKKDQVQSITYPESDAVEKVTKKAPLDLNRVITPGKSPLTTEEMGQLDNTNTFMPLFKMLTADKDVMADIEKLAEDPQIISFIEKPSVQEALNSGNYLKLLEDPDIWKLLENPNIQNLTGKVLDKPASPSPAEKSESATSSQEK